jgi:hypothetical protein
MIATMLDFFYKKVRFNHRDMKSNNVMYTFDSARNIQIRLIDFGFCCLQWNGIRIQGSQYFPPTANCFSLFRDMTQYLYEIYIDYPHFLSDKLKAQIREILTVNVNGTVCKMHEGCLKYGMITWPDNYNFLDRANVSNPAGNPRAIFDRFKQVFGVKDVDYNFTRLVPAVYEAIQCDPTEVLDPATGACLPKDSPRGSALVDSAERRSPAPVLPAAPAQLKPCKSPDQVRDPVTRRCRKVRAAKMAKSRKAAAAKNIMTRPCKSPDQIRDPVTRRCKKQKAGMMA